MCEFFCAMVRLAVLTTRTKRYHPNRRLLEAAISLGHSPCLLHPKQIQVEAGGKPLSIFKSEAYPQVILPRIGATIDDSELAAVFHMEMLGVPLINGFHSLVIARDKFLSLRQLHSARIPVPETYLVTEPNQLPSVIQELGGFPVVIKVLRGRQGTGVYFVDQMEFAQYLVSYPPRSREGVLVQEFLTSAISGDVRVLVVGDRMVAAMRRVPRQGNFRSNTHLRGRGMPWNSEPLWVDLALKATRVLGLQVSGVDLMEGKNGPVVLEVNTTPGFRELERVTGVDVAREIVLHAAEVAKSRG
jgi:ribosomal protein S6--L-glutamate ligase